MSKTIRQSGAVSIFSVIIAMLLMSVVTISFIRIMTSDQNRATGNDLAQSAYDSAQAGVEDAKRALVWYTEQCKISDAACSAAVNAINSSVCNAGIRAGTGMGTGEGEIIVQQSTQVDASGGSIDEALDQAYTCVTMQLATEDYVAPVPAFKSILVPLVADKEFKTVTIEWFTADDLPSRTTPVTLSSSSSPPKGLFTRANWGNARPSLLRTQFMQVGPQFTLLSFDTTTGSGQSNANTVFLYPTTDGNRSAELIAHDIRAQGDQEPGRGEATSTPLPTECKTAIAAGGYSCKIELSLPNPVGASNRRDATAYLRLTPFYNATNVRVTLGGGAKFYGVQPKVDATGRANNVFRRVEARVDLYDTSFPYPEAAVEVANSFCKDFGVTDTQYLAGSCTP